MKIKIIVYGRCTCGNDVLLCPQLKDWDNIVVMCDNKDEVWGDNGLYSCFSEIEFDAKDLVKKQNNIFDGDETISIKQITHKKIDGAYVRKYYQDLADCFVTRSKAEE